MDGLAVKLNYPLGLIKLSKSESE